MALWTQLLLAEKEEWAQITIVALGIIGSVYTRNFAPFSLSVVLLTISNITTKPLRNPVQVVNGPSRSPISYLREDYNTRAAIVPSKYAEIFNRRPVIGSFEATKTQDDELMNGTGSVPGPTKFVTNWY